MRTEKEICTKCYDIQDTCNFYPIVMELSRTLQDLKTAGISHEALYKHPAVIILVDKINDMMGRPDGNKVMDAFTYCRETKMGGDPKQPIDEEDREYILDGGEVREV